MHEGDKQIFGNITHHIVRDRIIRRALLGVRLAVKYGFKVTSSLPTFWIERISDRTYLCDFHQTTAGRLMWPREVQVAPGAWKFLSGLVSRFADSPTQLLGTAPLIATQQWHGVVSISHIHHMSCPRTRKWSGIFTFTVANCTILYNCALICHVIKSLWSYETTCGNWRLTLCRTTQI